MKKLTKRIDSNLNEYYEGLDKKTGEENARSFNKEISLAIKFINTGSCIKANGAFNNSVIIRGRLSFLIIVCEHIEKACDNYINITVGKRIPGLDLAMTKKELGSKSAPYLKVILKASRNLVKYLKKIRENFKPNSEKVLDEKTRNKYCKEYSKLSKSLIDSIDDAFMFKKSSLRSSYIPLLLRADVKDKLVVLERALASYDAELVSLISEGRKRTKIGLKEDFAADIDKAVNYAQSCRKSGYEWEKFFSGEDKGHNLEGFCKIISDACDKHIKKGLKGKLSKSTPHLKNISKYAKEFGKFKVDFKEVNSENIEECYKQFYAKWKPLTYAVKTAHKIDKKGSFKLSPNTPLLKATNADYNLVGGKLAELDSGLSLINGSFLGIVKNYKKDKS